MALLSYPNAAIHVYSFMALVSQLNNVQREEEREAYGPLLISSLSLRLDLLSKVGKKLEVGGTGTGIFPLLLVF